MCNANNHPPGCTCGWGGEGHLGRSSGAHRLPVPVLRPVLQSQFRVAESFTNPNANCPVCGAHVFFYQSPAGGRVFFDDLGPPWPKHPCTDNSASGAGVARTASTSAAAAPPVVGKGPRWLDRGWSPFICDDALLSTGDAGYCMLVGRLGETSMILYLCAPRIPDAALFQVRAARPNQFDVSMVWIDPTSHRVQNIVLKAFPSANLAAAWYAKTTKAGQPRLLRLVQAEMIKGTGGRGSGASAGVTPSKLGRVKRVHVNAHQKGNKTSPQPQNSRRSGPPLQKENTANAKKADVHREKLAPRQPELATGSQMWLAFAAARAKAKKTDR